MERLLPKLHVVTDDATLGRPDFLSVAARVLSAGGRGVALHIRGPSSSCAHVTALAKELQGWAVETGSVVFVNDRVDVALALDLAGVHLGQRSLAPPVARKLLGPGPLIGRSVHDAREGEDGENAAADFLVVGSVYRTSSHPGQRGRGVALLETVRAVTSLPVLAIGGITTSRVRTVLVPGVHGVMVLSGVWGHEDPGHAATEYLAELDSAAGSRLDG